MITFHWKVVKINMLFFSHSNLQSPWILSIESVDSRDKKQGFYTQKLLVHYMLSLNNFTLKSFEHVYGFLCQQQKGRYIWFSQIHRQLPGPMELPPRCSLLLKHWKHLDSSWVDASWVVRGQSTCRSVRLPEPLQVPGIHKVHSLVG